MVVAVKISRPSTTTSRATGTISQATMDIRISLTLRTMHGRTLLRTTVDEKIRFGPPEPTDATLSRRSFLKSAVVWLASPEASFVTGTYMALYGAIIQATRTNGLNLRSTPHCSSDQQPIENAF